MWHVCEIEYRRIHIDIDTTVETIYGRQQGGRKGHNTKNRGKKGFRPVKGFIGGDEGVYCREVAGRRDDGGEEVGSLSGV